MHWNETDPRLVFATQQLTVPHMLGDLMAVPPGSKDCLMQPFVQRGHDRTGLGLGLSICVEAMQTMSGELRVHDLPGLGCRFTLDLPRQPALPGRLVAAVPLLARALKLAAAG